MRTNNASAPEKRLQRDKTHQNSQSQNDDLVPDAFDDRKKTGPESGPIHGDHSPALKIISKQLRFIFLDARSIRAKRQAGFF
jgi:hypothetical protein